MSFPNLLTSFMILSNHGFISSLPLYCSAIIQPSTKTRMDIGLNIKGVAPSGNVEAAGSWNAMCTHRIKLENEKLINKDLFSWIKQSYDQAG